MNRYTTTARLVADPVYKDLGDKGHVVEMRIAVDGAGRGGRDQAGYFAFQDSTMTEKAARSLATGWLVGIAGRLQHDADKGDA